MHLATLKDTMRTYHKKLKRIKERGCKDFIKIKYSGKNVVLKLVDGSDETVKLLTNWRIKYRDMFATDFVISEEKTKNWIKHDVLENPDKIVFLIYVENRKIGIISTSNYDENTNSCILDTILKEPTFFLPGLMTTVEKVYLKWMFDELAISKITGFLFSDNKKMMDIHTKCGWIITDVVPIEKKSMNKNSEIIWQKVNSNSNNVKPKRYFNLVEITRENLMKNFNDIQYEVICD